MERMVQCNYCKDKLSISNAFFIESEPIYNKQTKKVVSKKKYYHHNCYKQFRNDILERTNLIQTIKKIHKISIIPPFFYYLLEELRHKYGYRYIIIEEAYKLAEAKMKKGIKFRKIDNINRELKYGYSTMSSYINDAIKRLSSKNYKNRGGG